MLIDLSDSDGMQYSESFFNAVPFFFAIKFELKRGHKRLYCSLWKNYKVQLDAYSSEFFKAASRLDQAACNFAYSQGQFQLLQVVLLSMINC